MDEQKIGVILAELRGSMDANFQHIIAGQSRQDTRIDTLEASAKREFEDVHGRVTRQADRLARAEEALSHVRDTLKDSTARRISITSAAIAGAGLIFTLAQRISWV